MINVSLQLLQLLLKSSQDKRFVCEEAERTLIGMTTSISPQPMLQKLQPYVSHRNPRVRAKAAMCMYNSVSRLVCPFCTYMASNLCL
jgi:endoribonuclease Dicer